MSDIESIGEIDTNVSRDESKSIHHERIQGEQKRMENRDMEERLMDYGPSSPNETMGYNLSHFRNSSNLEEKD